MSDSMPTPSLLRTSPAVGKVAEALAKAVAEFEQIAKDREVKVRSDKGSYTFTYATLAEIVSATRPALSTHGIHVLQMPAHDGRGLVLVTRIMHASGEWIEGTLPVTWQGNIQQLGSALTYLRRYAYSAALGIVATEDDDGNGAAGNQYDMRDRRDQRPPQRDERRDDRRSEPNGGIEPGSFVTADGKVMTAPDADTWVSNWMGRINKLMEAGDLATLQADYERNQPAIEATRAKAPAVAERVQKALDEALAKAKGGEDKPAPAWLIYHTDTTKEPDSFPGSAAWLGAWRIRANSTEGSKAPAKAKRDKIKAMLAVNEEAFAALEAAGQGRAVKEVRERMERLDKTLAEAEADALTGGDAA